MTKAKEVLLFIYLIYSVFSISDALKCGDQQIKDYEKCGSGDASNTCI